MQERLSTILGLCTAKADVGRYLKLSVQLCVTATQLSQNLLKQLPHRKWLSHCAMQVGLQAVLSHATQLSQHNSNCRTARLGTIVGLCTAKADFGRYLKLSVQLSVTATQLSQNRDLLKQLN